MASGSGTFTGKYIQCDSLFYVDHLGGVYSRYIEIDADTTTTDSVLSITSTSITSGYMIELYQRTSAFTTGVGLYMDFVSTSTADFINCGSTVSSWTSKFKVDYQGYCTAVKFYGDGSNLTGVGVTVPLTLTSADTDVIILNQQTVGDYILRCQSDDTDVFNIHYIDSTYGIGLFSMIDIMTFQAGDGVSTGTKIYLNAEVVTSKNGYYIGGTQSEDLLDYDSDDGGLTVGGQIVQSELNVSMMLTITYLDYLSASGMYQIKVTSASTNSWAYIKVKTPEDVELDDVLMYQGDIETFDSTINVKLILASDEEGMSTLAKVIVWDV
jgi:hypothetical protein